MKQHDDQKVKDYGVSLAVDIIRRITTEAKDIRGVHFCTLNLERSVQLVLEKLRWAGGSPLLQNQVILVRPTPTNINKQKAFNILCIGSSGSNHSSLTPGVRLVYHID